MEKIEAAQEALTEAQNAAKTALNDYADEILDTYEGKLTAKQAREIAAAVEAGEKAIDAAAETGVDAALEKAEDAIDAVAAGAVAETDNEKLVAEATGKLEDVELNARNSNEAWPEAEEIIGKLPMVEGVSYTLENDVDWKNPTKGESDECTATVIVNVTAGTGETQVTDQKEIKVSYVATDYENVKNAYELIKDNGRYAIEISYDSSLSDCADALEAVISKQVGDEVTVTVKLSGTFSYQTFDVGNIVTKSGTVNIVDKDVSSTAVNDVPVAVDITITM